MSEPTKCPQCGSSLAPGALGGLCPACLLEQGNATESGSRPSEPFRPPQISELAEIFPQLEINELLGKGGMGAVYKARQPALDRNVALKILAPSAAGGTAFEQRFNREARALAKLNHPNIIGVYEFGEAGGLHYFMMEYVDGPNLRQLQRAGRLSPREALQIVPQICDALQYAHDEGVVHRDIKPENVMMDRKGRVKIADFGLARILGIDAEALRLTGEGHVMGTPHYMAPEQLEHPLEVDHRADIYSLGVIFYEMLTGELPLGRFGPPSARAGNVQVDVRLDDVVLRALEKEPERRYQQVSEVKTRLQTLTSQVATNNAKTTAANREEPESAPRSSGAARLAMRLAVILLCLVIGLIVLGVVGLVVPYLAARRDSPEAATSDARYYPPLPANAVELIAIGEHPRGRWWNPDGTPAEFAFENEGSLASADQKTVAREQVFRSDLPEGSSKPKFEFEPAASWTGGGPPLVDGKPLAHHHLVAGRFLAKERFVTVRVGVGHGDWQEIAQKEGAGSSSQSMDRNGEAWDVAFASPLRTADGRTVVSVSLSPTAKDTRLRVVTFDGQERKPAKYGVSKSGRVTVLVAEYPDLPLAELKSVLLEARPIAWKTFENVPLYPSGPSARLASFVRPVAMLFPSRR